MSEPPKVEDYEKLGAFYLGREYDLEGGETTDELLLYDPSDLTTHAICVGMTGSGKTGLCITLLEEAAIDGIPSIVIDPKGDMGNLLLQFPELRGPDFAEWVDPHAAASEGSTPAELGQKTASLWKKGLAEWGQDGERIQRLLDAADMTIYTPGSSAGMPLTVLRSFHAPPQALRDDAEAFAERTQSAVSGLLALLGIDSDPVRSREAILLANIVQRAWAAGEDLELADLIRAIQKPPFEKLGVMDVESFFPAKERFELAMALNSLLASPAFAPWMEGEPLDIQRLLYTAEGKPRVSVLSIAHLSDSERMFFVTLLLSEVVAWMRAQSGTGSLRALLYMDEIFGFVPPTAAPPSKKPMLTLLKQARAYGLGVVLATQNPVDLDYKGLSNTGTWFIGRLQTERDKKRLLDGLEGAMNGAKAFDRREMDELLSSLGKRVFLMNNVHEEKPVIFHTRWALSYLRGPLTRPQLEKLMEGKRTAHEEARASAQGKIAQKSRPKAAPKPAASTDTVHANADAAGPKKGRPVLPAGIEELFQRPEREAHSGGQLLYRPALACEVRLHHVNSRAKVDRWSTVTVTTPLSEDERPDWDDSTSFSEPLGLRKSPLPGAAFDGVPAEALRASSYKKWLSGLKTYVYQHHPLILWKHDDTKLVSEPGESQGDYRVRVMREIRDDRDLAIKKLRKKYEPKVERLRERVRKAEAKLGREEEQYKRSRNDSWISIGSTLLGALLGRKKVSATNVRRGASAAKSVGRADAQKADIARAQEDLEAEAEKLEAMEEEFEAELELLEEAIRPAELELEELLVRPRKGDIILAPLRVVWTPWSVDANGLAAPLA